MELKFKLWGDYAFDYISVFESYKKEIAKTTTIESIYDLIDWMELNFNFVSDTINATMDGTYTREECNNFLGMTTLQYIASLSMLMVDRLSPVSIDMPTEVSSLLVRKQKDYGPNNILQFGLIGVYVRMFDKFARLKNILGKFASPEEALAGNAVSGETLIDTLFDMIGYCTIAQMLLNESFMLPLE